MADSTEQLDVKITADGSQAAAGISDVAAAAERLGVQMEFTGAAGERMGSALAQAHAIAAGKAVQHAEAESILGASIGKVEIATNSAARAFGALGLRSAEATERVLAVTEALEAFEASAGPLIAIGAVLLGIGAAANFVREGIADAANEQREFASMATAVRIQGGNWDVARESIEKFTSSLAAATTFSKGEAIGAIDSLISSGIAYTDAEKMVAIATDVASAKHVALITVTDAMREAEAGRGMGLLKLDSNLKQLIESHAHASVVFNKLSQDMSGQAAAAAETLEGKETRLRNEIEFLSTQIGTMLLPALEHGVEFFTDLTSAMERAGDAASRTGRLIGDVFKLNSDIHGLNSGAIGGDVDALGRDWKPINEDLAHWNNASADMKKAREAWVKERAQLNATPFVRDPVIGRDPKPKKEKAEQAPVAFEDIDVDPTPKIDRVVAAQKLLDDALKATTASEAQYKLAVELAITSDGKASAEAALRTKIAEDASEASVRLGRQIAAERLEITALSSQHAAAAASALRLADAHNTLDHVLVEHQDRSKVAAQRVAELRKESEAADRTAKTLASSIATLTQQLNTNSDALARQPALAEGNARAQAALVLAYNNARDAETEKLAVQSATNGKSLEVELAYWQKRIAELDKGSSDYLATLAQFQARVDDTNTKIGERNTKYAAENAARAQSVSDEEATYKASLGQQLSYYEQRYADTVSAGDQYSSEARSLSEKIKSIELDEFKAREDAHAAFLKNFQDSENSIINTVIEKHQSMRDALKSVWSDMVKNYEQSLEQMIEKSAILNGLNSKILGFLSPSGAAGGAGNSLSVGSQGASEAASQYGITGLVLGKSGAAQAVNSLPTGYGATGLLVGSDAAQAVANGYRPEPLNSNPLGGSGSGGSQGTGGAASSGGSFLSNAVGSVATGGTIGSAVASLDGGNSTYGAAGGALGGIAGLALHANPLIGAGIDAVTGLLGSLLTGGKPTLYKNPDIEDTQNYGQTIADLLGHAGANGTTFYEDSTTKSLFGGGTALAGLEQLAAGGQSAFTTSTGLGADVYKQLVADVGSSASGSGTLNFDKNIGSEYVTGAAGAGATFRYTDIESLIAQIEKGLQNGGGGASVPTFSVTRTYADPNQTGLVSDGSITPTKANLLPSSASANGVSITITGNTIVGPGGLDGVAKDIGIAIGRVQSGQIAGRSTVTPVRFRGGE